MKILLLLSCVLFAGCQTRPLAKPAEPPPVIAPLAATHARLPAMIGHYTVGAYVDPDNPLIRHDAHAIQRVEREASWDLRPLPEPSLPTAQPVAPTMAVPVAVTDVPPVAAGAVVSSPARVRPEASVTTPSAPTQPEIAAAVPNADGLVDLTAPAPEEGGVNPFAVRSVRPEATREVALQVTGIIHGAAGCALVNDRSIQPGESVDSLLLVRLETDAVLFRSEETYIRVAVGGKPARVRLAL